MSVNRDFAFIIDKVISVENVIKAAKNADKKLIDQITLLMFTRDKELIQIKSLLQSMFLSSHENIH